jgi:glycine oxidase
MPQMHPDIVVVGGGVVGCAIARELARAGAKVVVVERGEIGREASWAAGGILTPVHLAEYPGPLAGLCRASASLYPSLVEDLRRETSIDIEYRVSGMLMLARNNEDRRAIETLATWKRERGQPVEPVESPRDLEPVLASALRGGLLLPDVAQVRNNRVAPALAESARKSGVEVRATCEVTGFTRVPGRITGVKTTRGDILADETVIAAGAWSTDLLGTIGIHIDVHPVRGQMVLLESPPELVKRIMLWSDRYIVPRVDGRLVVGSTIEDVGFDKRVTASGIASILSSALEVAPELARLPVLQTWAGLRPATADRLPYLGRPPELAGLVLATGHFRNGILLAPITARLTADVIAGRSPSIDLSAFRPDR